METKYIFITGGVVSSLGKGVTGASLGRLLKSRGYTVAMMKFDPYINVDPGTMNPFQHGEVFVTEDGLETDLDLGHYERFADVTMARGQNITTGRIYNDLIDRERQGVYMGGTLQVIPHVTGAIQMCIRDRFPYQPIVGNAAVPPMPYLVFLGQDQHQTNVRKRPF